MLAALHLPNRSLWELRGPLSRRLKVSDVLYISFSTLSKTERFLLPFPYVLFAAVMHRTAELLGRMGDL
jgi:hypothetical protein